MAMTFPDWSAMTPEYAAAELPRLLVEAEKKVSALEAAKPDTYETLVWALDDAVHPLLRLWGYVAHMLSVMNTDAWRKIEETFQPQIVVFSLRVGQSQALYAATKALCAREADPVRRRILEKSVQSAELAGVGLEGDAQKRFNEIAARLAQLGADFSNAVLDATKAFSYEKAGKTYTIDDAAYPETMKHCADREVREHLCVARATRASENAARITEILALRREQARLLGFADAVELSLATKCAPSAAAVFEMIEALDAATQTLSAREEAALVEEAARDGLSKLEPWDRAYYAERLRERTYSYSEEELKKCFPFETVLSGLFRLTSFLFAVEVVEIEGSAKPSVWHPDVRFFEVREKGAVIAHFYLDPYVRSGLKSGGAWMNDFADLSARRGETPLALLALNLPRPDAEGRTLLPFREVETVFHEFGHALQQMLTRVTDEGASGLSLIEWDAVELASQFMENWCLDARTGIEVPAELKAKVRAAKNFRAASACRRQLAFAKTDLRLHGAASVAEPDAVKREEFAHFGLPTVAGDGFLNAFTHIFAGGYAAGYYSYKWSEVMSADCYGAFEEAPLTDDAAVRATGARYRETVLALGGSVSAYEVFRRFRGRKPQIDAILRQQGLIPHS